MFAKTPRLIIRDLQDEDWQPLLALTSDPEVIRGTDGYLPPNEADLKEWLSGAIFHNRQEPRYAHNSAIVLKSKDEVIGWDDEVHYIITVDDWRKSQNSDS